MLRIFLSKENTLTNKVDRRKRLYLLRRRFQFCASGALSLVSCCCRRRSLKLICDLQLILQRHPTFCCFYFTLNDTCTVTSCRLFAPTRGSHAEMIVRDEVRADCRKWVCIWSERHVLSAWDAAAAHPAETKADRLKQVAGKVDCTTEMIVVLHCNAVYKSEQPWRPNNPPPSHIHNNDHFSIYPILRWENINPTTLMCLWSIKVELSEAVLL